MPLTQRHSSPSPASQSHTLTRCSCCPIGLLTIGATHAVILAVLVLAVFTILVKLTTVGTHGPAIDKIVFQHLHVLLRSENLLHLRKIILAFGLAHTGLLLPVLVPLVAPRLQFLLPAGLQSCDLGLLFFGQGYALQTAYRLFVACGVILPRPIVAASAKAAILFIFFI